jgi:hypothetical protein
MCPRPGGPGGDAEAQRRAAGLAVGETGQGSGGAQQVMGDRGAEPDADEQFEEVFQGPQGGWWPLPEGAW